MPREAILRLRGEQRYTARCSLCSFKRGERWHPFFRPGDWHWRCSRSPWRPLSPSWRSTAALRNRLEPAEPSAFDRTPAPRTCFLAALSSSSPSALKTCPARTGLGRSTSRGELRPLRRSGRVPAGTVPRQHGTNDLLPEQLRLRPGCVVMLHQRPNGGACGRWHHRRADCAPGARPLNPTGGRQRHRGDPR